MNQPAPVDEPVSREQVTDNLWQKANLKLLVKTLSELSWEEAIKPTEIVSGQFRLDLDSGVSYQFSAFRSIWGQLLIDSKTVSRTPPLPAKTADVSQFFIDARTELGFDSATLCNFLEELGNTLMAESRLQDNHRTMTACDMIQLPADELQSQLDGHPKVTVSKGRMGWGLNDFEAFATEFLPDIQLEWLALSRKKCHLRVAGDLDEQHLLDATLSQSEQERLQKLCQDRDIDRSHYLLMPVHPWQWLNKIVNLFAGEIAAGHIIHLGRFGDPMLPQQSLRTLSNRVRPQQLNIKLPLSILNTSCYRGIPGRYITAGPALSKWLAEIAAQDEVLASRGTIILEEPAGAFYPHPLYDQVADGPYRYHEMLGCIWRQSVHSKTAPEEQPVLISTLFQKDGDGQSLVEAYIHRSGLTTEAWLNKLFNVVVIPLYHLMCQYGVGLVAHGQNVTLVLADNQPAKVALKDFQGDLRLINQNFPELDSLPEEVRTVTTRLPPEHLIHDLQTGHFVSVLRFISNVLAETGFSEHRFYQLLGQQLQSYMSDHPSLADRFKLFDLFETKMARICLNWVRFRLGYGDSTERPLPELGSNLANPLALTLQG
ncbi:IucA/IucC family siderophore biosynthesis protein [Endozoicomonas gorgoniicola]|uniref:IucA/IucC family siderophore biosynthesis protein n=1 Tax=Endozoicomonas gorgoniicola TaxID=1234144 RepID=A0ABT3N0J7_9GAMM|nr:IucA/IucC family siderophore biosynthesis protein [Endozoicomonas gorgoniicola]MCW7555146.1 IucA/IucC family siderophore biosynthesis protein [Endozoicomonas gorgoniicola]